MFDFTEDEIGRLLKGLDIPPCPAILSALMQELRKDEANVGRVARLISQDVALAAGIMKIANSALFAPARQVGSSSGNSCASHWRLAKRRASSVSGTRPHTPPQSARSWRLLFPAPSARTPIVSASSTTAASRC
jgi:hypothetical protein